MAIVVSVFVGTMCMGAFFLGYLLGMKMHRPALSMASSFAHESPRAINIAPARPRKSEQLLLVEEIDREVGSPMEKLRFGGCIDTDNVLIQFRPQQKVKGRHTRIELFAVDGPGWRFYQGETLAKYRQGRAKFAADGPLAQLLEEGSIPLIEARDRLNAIIEECLFLEVEGEKRSRLQKRLAINPVDHVDYWKRVGGVELQNFWLE